MVRETPFGSKLGMRYAFTVLILFLVSLGSVSVFLFSEPFATAGTTSNSTRTSSTGQSVKATPAAKSGAFGNYLQPLLQIGVGFFSSIGQFVELLGLGFETIGELMVGAVAGFGGQLANLGAWLWSQLAGMLGGALPVLAGFLSAADGATGTVRVSAFSTLLALAGTQRELQC